MKSVTLRQPCNETSSMVVVYSVIHEDHEYTYLEGDIRINKATGKIYWWRHGGWDNCPYVIEESKPLTSDELAKELNIDADAFMYYG